jgi:hypothetical protein
LGSLYWHQETPQYLKNKSIDGQRIYEPGVGQLYESASSSSRIPFGHPEGYLEAFATLYRNFARTVRKRTNGEAPNEFDLDFPTIDDGIRGMQFVETVISSGKAGAKWTKFKS